MKIRKFIDWWRMNYAPIRYAIPGLKLSMNRHAEESK